MEVDYYINQNTLSTSHHTADLFLKSQKSDKAAHCNSSLLSMMTKQH
jgi:hypothetical protein